MSTNVLPISRKAYSGFIQRIRQVYSFDPDRTEAMENALRLYLDNDSAYSLAFSEADRHAFEFLRHDIDTAIDRSRRARERARLRKEAKAQATSVAEDSKPATASNQETPKADNSSLENIKLPEGAIVIPVVTPDRLRTDSNGCIVIDSDETDPIYDGPVEVRIDPSGCQPYSYSLKYPAPAPTPAPATVSSAGTRSQRRAEERRAKKDLLAAMRRIRNIR
ncbi:MAG: hypothetical protein NC349_06810 [Paenibacillus sp.]|nr:hypothetical protein [Paenibacillus sp.]